MLSAWNEITVLIQDLDDLDTTKELTNRVKTFDSDYINDKSDSALKKLEEELTNLCLDIIDTNVKYLKDE